MIPSTRHSRSAGVTAPLVIVLLLAAVGMVLFFHRMFPPAIMEQGGVFAAQYDSSAMLAAVASAAVTQEQSLILAQGSRFLGQPGAAAMADAIRERYLAAGLELLEQDNNCAVPRTLQREISTPDGKPLEGVDIYPFLPNHLQPMNTPEEGLAGKLVLVNDEALESRRSFRNCIGLIDARDQKRPRKLGFQWTRYARLGLDAVIVAHPDGLTSIPWDRVAGGEECMVSTLPINYVRLAATPQIFNYVNQEITLRVRTEFSDTRHTTVVGVLRAPHSDGSNALILSCDYAACSPLPDLAPGGMQAVGPALHLALLKGLLAYRDHLERDVIFISYGGPMMSHDGKQNLLRILGANQGGQSGTSNPVLRALGRTGDRQAQVEVQSETKKYNLARAAEHRRALELLHPIRQALKAKDLFRSPTAMRKALNSLNADAKILFNEQIQYVLDALILELSEPTLQAKIAFEKLPDRAIASPEFAVYQKAKAGYEQAMSVAGFSLEQIISSKQDYLAEYQVVERFMTRFDKLLAYHETALQRLAQDRALIELLGGYREKAFIHPLLAPAEQNTSTPEGFSFIAGCEGDTQPQSFNELCVWASQRRGFTDDQLTILSYTKDHERNNWPHLGGVPAQFVGAFGSGAGYSFFSPINRNRGSSYLTYTYPVNLPFMENLTSLDYSMQLMGEVVLALALGNRAGEFRGRLARFGNDSANINFGGRVLVSNVGQSMVPSFPLENALVSGARTPRYPLSLGFCDHPFYFTDPYGRYDLPYHLFNFASGWGGYSPLAVGFGKNGGISFMKDEGPSGQRLFKSTGINTWVADIIRNVTIVTFRATPVTLFDLLNPQSMREYTGVELISKHGLVSMPRICRFPQSGVREGVHTTFIPPEEYFFVKLLAGSPDNEFASETRGFMLNITDDFVPDPLKEIDGAGYLGKDSAMLRNVAADTARSMAFLNGQRLAMQKRHNMVDDRTQAYHLKSLALAADSQSGELPQAESARKARESITYSALNHPVLRESIFEAVLGILWYLALLVPFVFFFEKLVFGFADIRKQLLAQGVVFMAVFGALSVLHPAFEMVRSPLMILLGFVMILISGGVTIMLSGKFQENLEDLRKKSGKVKAAEVNTMSAVGSAFMLGLNNMHRRKLRTGMTCATLVLMTFVMICFTSVRSNLVDEQITLGKAGYQGLLIKKDRFRSMTSDEVYALKERYGHAFDICPRTYLIGNIDWDSYYQNPNIEVVYKTPQGTTKLSQVKSILTFTDRDPIRNLLDFKSRKTWFSAADCFAADTPPPVMISDLLAEFLGINVDDVNAGTAWLSIHSETYPIKAMFAADSWEQIQDLDGRSLLPFDINALAEVNFDQRLGQVLADDDAVRISARDIIIFPAGQAPESCQGTYSKQVVASTVVAMPELSYPEAKEIIDAYMEQSARSVHYGLDGMAYLGKRVRESSMVGLIDMLIPLVIAALVVLNTIRGSVYERRDEIYVYNAVGIAPRYVFFMFFAEAIVYAVVGAVLGYILSQGVGRTLTALDLTGGMNMTFTSLTTIYASLAIAGATFISTFFPARTAMEIATPADDAGWQLPAPQDDLLSFDLPFTFTHRDRVAVLSFFHRYLLDHGEGSAGRFFAGPPRIGLSDRLDELADQAYIPQIANTVWLKPFDLSVSQNMVISMPTDRETDEFKAHIELLRLSGTREAWLRLNHGFVSQVRKHFLHWRAVSEEDRWEMYTEGCQLMDEGTGVERQEK